MTFRRMRCPSVFVVLWAVFVPPVSGERGDDKYVAAVRTFADNVLKHARDTYGPKHTPMFVDGLDMETLEPGKWRFEGAPQPAILSNFASHQNLLRVLDGLTAVTGDPKYRAAALEEIKWGLRNLQGGNNGLLCWGGHCSYDAAGDYFVGSDTRDRPTWNAPGLHELKRHFPHYDLFWQVDPQTTQRFIEALWSANVVNWDSLEFNRHGRYEKTLSKPWPDEYKRLPLPLLTYNYTLADAAGDMVFSAVLLSRYTNDERPLVWAKRLVQRYVDVRDPKTGLGAEIYNEDPKMRTRTQFPQFGGRFNEASVTNMYGERYGVIVWSQMKLAELLGPQDKGREFRQWAVKDLIAYARNAYDETDHSFWVTLNDGTRLKPEDRTRPGYISGRWLAKRPASSLNFVTYPAAIATRGGPTCRTASIHT